MSWLLRAFGPKSDPDARPRSREEVLVFVALHAICLAVAVRTVASAVAPLTKAAPVPLVPEDRPGERFGVKDEIRKKIFQELAAAEPEHRLKGRASFPTEAWSAEDHRASFERHLAANIAARYGLSLSQVYLIFDEGIRERWPGPDGQPLSPQTVPLKPRRKY